MLVNRLHTTDTDGEYLFESNYKYDKQTADSKMKAGTHLQNL